MLANIFWDSFSSWARWRLTQTGQHCWSADVGQNVGRFAPPAPSIILRILAMKICMAPWSWAGFLQPRSHNFCLAFWIYDGAVLSFYQKLWKSPPKRRMAFMWITLLLTERYLINTAPLFWLLSIIIAVPRGMARLSSYLKGSWTKSSIWTTMTSLFFYDECISIVMRGESLEKTLYDNFKKRHRRKKSQKIKKNNDK